jgi:hypothetical protein
MQRARVAKLLRQHEGKLWISKPGPKNSLCYFPIPVVPKTVLGQSKSEPLI